jgi:DNA adenine methylase
VKHISDQPTRTVLRYFGGKWKVAPHIISHFPKHKTYVEPFGGAASVLLRKSRSDVEVYNDLDGTMVNLFTVVRDHGEELARRLYLTPYARTEFFGDRKKSTDPIEWARKTAVQAFLGYGSNGLGPRSKTGFRSITDHGAKDWTGYPESLLSVMERLRGVIIEHRCAVEVIDMFDDDDTFFYVDPPYVHETRDSKANYTHEMTDDDHTALAQVLHSVVGKVIISGYACPLYDKLYADWLRKTFKSFADITASERAVGPREEVLWISPNAAVPRSRGFFA